MALDNIASLALLVGVTSPSMEGLTNASASRKLEGSKGAVYVRPDQGRTLFVEEDQMKVKLFEVSTDGRNNAGGD
jgi:hypothetical protein